MEPSKELQVEEKQAVPVPAEQTRPGLVFTPAKAIPRKRTVKQELGNSAYGR